jgi:hypothetical protein
MNIIRNISNEFFCWFCVKLKVFFSVAIDAHEHDCTHHGVKDASPKQWKTIDIVLKTDQDSIILLKSQNEKQS